MTYYATTHLLLQSMKMHCRQFYTWTEERESCCSCCTFQLAFYFILSLLTFECNMQFLGYFWDSCVPCWIFSSVLSFYKRQKSELSMCLSSCLTNLSKFPILFWLKKQPEFSLHLQCAWNREKVFYIYIYKYIGRGRVKAVEIYWEYTS